MSAIEEANDHDAIIGQAYARGLADARDGTEDNPFFRDTELHIAYASGYQNRKAWLASHNN